MPSVLLALAVTASAAPVAAQPGTDDMTRRAQAQIEADRARRELDRAAADAQTRAAADRARIVREESDRLAAESRHRAALAAEHARRASEMRAQSQAAQAEADLVRRNAEQRARIADEEVRRLETLQRRTETVRDGRETEPPTYTLRRRGTTQPPKPERRPDDPGRPIAMKEGVALCERGRGDQWRCTGPVRVGHGNIETSRTAAAQACGTDLVRSLGAVHGLRAFGCGYGLNPRSAAPGNRDVPALFRIDVPGRTTFRCPASVEARCLSR